MTPAAGTSTNHKIRVGILDDHQPIIDGYRYRLSQADDISVVGTISYGDELEPLLSRQPVDVLILDISVPTSPENHNPYPILHVIPNILEHYPELAILVISMHTQRPLIQAVLETGISGYILKEDHASIRELAAIIRTLAEGSVFFSQQAYDVLLRDLRGRTGPALSNRQLEALSLCAAYPDASLQQLAHCMNVANSTLRNLLSEAYLRLGVRTRAAAVAKGRQMGLLPPEQPGLPLE